MTSDPANKRQSERVPFILKVDYPNASGFADATENLSHGGLFVQTERRFEINERLPLSLSFPGLMNPVEIVGRVAWLRPPRGDSPGGVGISVERDEDKRVLEGLMNAGGTQPRTVDLASMPADGFRVLIVEDNPHIIEMYSYVLKKLAAGELQNKIPLEVSFAPDGHHALKMLLEGHFSLVLTDLYMPVMDGFQLIERIRHEDRLKSLPLIAISAGGKDAQERAMQLGVDIYLRKPVKFVEVLETVKTLLRIK
jgi:uncharacterized protein (TIGR02266 family)